MNAGAMANGCRALRVFSRDTPTIRRRQLCGVQFIGRWRASVPYELSFTKAVGVRDRAQYINECCVGGDVVRDALLPLVTGRYEDVQTEQEDWGWFIWFRTGPVRLAIDIFTDDPDLGEFRIHLTSRVKRFLTFERVADGPELDELRDAVVERLSAWAGGVSCEAIPADQMG